MPPQPAAFTDIECVPNGTHDELPDNVLEVYSSQLNVAERLDNLRCDSTTADLYIRRRIAKGSRPDFHVSSRYGALSDDDDDDQWDVFGDVNKTTPCKDMPALVTARCEFCR